MRREGRTAAVSDNTADQRSWLDLSCVAPVKRRYRFFQIPRCGSPVVLRQVRQEGT